MNSKLGKLILMVTTLVLLLVLTVGHVPLGTTYQIAEPKSGIIEMWDGMHGLLAPVAGGGSSAG